MLNGFIIQLLWGTLITIKLAAAALMLGMVIGLLAAIFSASSSRWVRYPIHAFIFLVRGLPELLVLFFIYFGLTQLLTSVFHHYINVSAFFAGVTALGCIFGAYASQVFRGAFLAVDAGQIAAGQALGLSSKDILLRITIPQAWRHALPGLGNLWLVLLKDTAIVTLIGLNDLMSQAKFASSATQQPFTFYMIAAIIYLVITSFSDRALYFFTQKANRYI